MENPAQLLNYAGVAAAAAAVGVFWNQIRGAMTAALTWFMVSSKLDSETGRAVIWYLRQVGREPMRGSIFYQAQNEYVRDRRRYAKVAREQSSTGKLLLAPGWVPVFLTAEAPDKESSRNDFDDGPSYKMTTLRWALDPEKLIADALGALADAKADKRKGRRHWVRRMGAKSANTVSGNGHDAGQAEIRYIGYRHDELGSPIPDKPFGQLAYDEGVMGAVEICRKWLGSKEWYEQRGLAWRMGMLFGGAPGTGKTSCVRAIAQDLDVPLFLVDLTGVSNAELVEIWGEIRSNAPAIALFEDLDRVPVATVDSEQSDSMALRRGRDGSMEPWNPLTLDCLLGCISGVEPSEGILVIATANEPGRLSPALGVFDEHGVSSRPGRLDFSVTFNPLTVEARTKVAIAVLGAEAPADQVAELVRAGEGETGAQFVQRASQEALRGYWTGKKE